MGQLDVVSEAGGDRPQTQGNVRLWLRLVGDFSATLENGRSVLPVSKKARGLLALVAAHMPQPLRRDYAASLLWSNKPRDHAANSMRQALRELQIALAACGQPPILSTASGRLSLPSASLWVDIHDPAAIKWKEAGEGAAGPLLLCQNLQGLDPAFDAHLEKLWKNLVFQQAFVPLVDDFEGNYVPARFPSLDLEVQDGPTDALVADEEPTPLSTALPTLADDSIHGQGWRIAVLPFRSLGSPLDAGLSLGMAEEISAALARFRMPRLIATGSFWDGYGASADALAKCRAYNLDYVICGTIQSSGSRIRVTVTLLDVSMDFEVIWASRFEGTTEDLFSLQDKIASQTVAQIDPELLQRHHFRGGAMQLPNAAAHQAVLTAIQGIYHPDKSRFLQSKAHLLSAISLDPDYAAAHAWLAYWYVNGMAEGWLGDPTEAAMQAGLAADRAVSLDPIDARGLSIAGHVKAYLHRDLEAALVLHGRATMLNPNLPIAWTLSSWTHVYRGEHATAVDHALTAEALSPNDPHVFAVEHAAMTARFFMGDLVAADQLAATSLERRPRHATALKVRLAILGHLQRPEQASRCLEALRGLQSELTVDAIIARPPLRAKDREFYAAGLRLAGIRD